MKHLLLCIFLFTQCYSTAIVNAIEAQPAVGQDNKTFSALIENANETKFTINLPPLNSENQYRLLLKIIRKGEDLGAYSVKSGCGCLSPTLKEVEGGSALLDIAIDLTAKRDQLQQSIYLIGDNSKNITISVNADVGFSRVTLDRELIVFSSTISEEKAIFAHFEPKFDNISQAYVRDKSVSVKLLEKKKTGMCTNLRVVPQNLQGQKIVLSFNLIPLQVLLKLCCLYCSVKLV